MVEFGQKSLNLFFMVSSNLDMFRDFVFNSNFLNAYDISPAVVKKIKEDELELLKFSLKWLRFTMFGEGDFKVKDEARRSARERQKAAALEKTRQKEEKAKKALSRTPEEVMKEADREEN
jgi:hypothetical protein